MSMNLCIEELTTVEAVLIQARTPAFASFELIHAAFFQNLLVECEHLEDSCST